MIDPRYANAGAVPLASGYGGQQLPAQYQHHHRHHRHHKHKVRNDQSPVSVDESIHKVDHSQPQHFHQNDGAQFNSGYGVPYGATGFGGGAPAYYPQQQQQQQQQYGAAGYGNQYQGASYGQQGPSVKHHRRHHRHHRHHHGAEGAATHAGSDQPHVVPEQLIGQRSSSVLGKDQHHSPGPRVEGVAGGDQIIHRRHHRHHRHHHSGEHVSSALGQHSHHEQHSHHGKHSHHSHHHGASGGGGYGHINDELIFIERGDHSPHRQEPPSGYEYKGKIEVQNYDREIRSHFQGQGAVVPPPPSAGPCPPGWQQMIVSGGSCGPCPSGGVPYNGQLVGGAGSYGSFGGGSAGSYGSYGGGGALPPNCQVVADYVFGSNSGGVVPSGGYGGQQQNQNTETNVTTRATIIEVWQKRAKSEVREKSRSRSRSRSRSPKGPEFDFERFRAEILAAIERAVARDNTGREGGTQTQIHPAPINETRIIERHETAGEVRVIVQPIQPVFYMPRQTAGPAPVIPQIGPVPIAPLPAPASAPQIVYVPRNVYVPVIKPVFVPRERIIVRPQVIHVARPVLVDRPVPVTQRPIIIDRERPIPVPVRGGGQGVAQGGGSKVVREEFVYRDNVPVAYGGRCAEFAGGANYGYTPAQQEHQYANSSTHETGSLYQGHGQNVNIQVPNQFQQSHSSSHVEVQQGGDCGGGGSYHGSYSNLAEVGGLGGASAVNVGNRSTQIEVLDPAVNPCWQKTDQSALMRRYGRPAFEIVHKSDEVEQQMYNEIRHRTSSGMSGGGVIRSSSTASYGSGTGLVGGGLQC